MPRQRDPNRDEALLLFKEHNGDITNRAIAEKLGVLEKTISAWKNRDKWKDSLDGVECSTTKKKRSTTKVKEKPNNLRSVKKKQVIDALVEAGTYSPALDLLIEIYLDAYEEYSEDRSEKLRKELAKYLGQLGLDGKNKDLIKKSGRLLAKGDEENEKEKQKDEPTEENNNLLHFRRREHRGNA
ncbi:phage terminase small subunit-related protein [Niallia taxi]|uniref:phage terminase small subunit-related protein n=1 Tax=Niallia taxi TaxID=2499688 RepID=UPI002550D9C7|nr:phage terminase small subunit-related protein [Niallia taxi]MDK8641322.1 phage terminase small subunit-related protein [Niallia taxi]